ncbi:unnamed protein product [Angiostrongylus costaricensis]|uniref:Cadherin domain-containing protein n=1 Tax=Angiostrongylus costaricensis TaxID=334426 RepID=A0A0R3PXQ7_ANGCS|nr:unnamed protein product [Angiostrongylus costaricensis]
MTTTLNLAARRNEARFEVVVVVEVADVEGEVPQLHIRYL